MSAPRRYDSPECSTAIQVLVDQADAAGFEGDSVWEILWLITAHRDLLGFAVAAERILAILDRIQNKEEWREALHEADIGAWTRFLEWVVAEREALTRAIGEEFGQELNSAGNNPVRGNGSSEFPFYAVLCEPLRMGEDNERFLLLSAHLFLAYVIAMREHSTVDDYRRWGAEKDWKFLPNEVDAAARAVRRHAESERHHFLADLPFELPPEEFAVALEDLPPADDERIEDDRVQLRRFLQKCWGLVPWREGKGAPGQGGGKRWVGGGYENQGVIARREPVGDADDPFADWGGADWLLPKMESTRRRNALIDFDLDPDEDGADEEVLLGGLDCEEARRDPGALARLARAKARHVAKSHQLLPWDYALLTDEEFARLYAAFQDETGKLLRLSRWEKAERLRAETIVALMGMLLTASGIERIHRLKIGPPDGPAEVSDIQLVLTPEPYWLMPAHEPAYAHESNDEAEGLRKRVHHIPLPWRGGRVIELCPKLLGERWVAEAVRLFATPLDALQREADAWLKSHFQDRRVTLAKIESHLWLRMAQLTGDPAHAACLFGSQGTLAEVRLFYTTLWSNRLQILYKELLKQQGYRGYGGIVPLDKGTAVGARLCPTAEALAKAIGRLREEVIGSASWQTRRAFIAHHNHLTLYLLQGFAYATAIRAIATPYVRLEEIDSSRGLVFIDDKDDERKRKTRLAWVPPSLLESMQAYEAHLALARAWISEWNAVARLPCFFLDERFQPIEARPKEIEKRLAPYLPVKANTHRRFLRTELLERGGSPEVIDALLGHWQVGEEPFGPYSSLSIEHYVEALRRYLLPLLGELGFLRALSLPKTA